MDPLVRVNLQFVERRRGLFSHKFQPRLIIRGNVNDVPLLEKSAFSSAMDATKRIGAHALELAEIDKWGQKKRSTRYITHSLQIIQYSNFHTTS